MSNRRVIERSVYRQKASLYIGNYSESISLATSHLSDDSESVMENQLILYRARLCQKEFDVVLNDVRNDDEKINKVVRTYALALKHEHETDDDDQSFDKYTSEFDGWLVDPDYQKDIHFLFIATRFYTLVGDTRKAFRCCHSCSTIDLAHLYIRLCLELQRPDEALKGLAKMKELDELCLMTQLTDSYYKILNGGQVMMSGATSTLRHIEAKYGPCLVCQSLLAVANMRKKKWKDAQKSLVDAWAKEANNGSTLSNLCVCESNLGNVKRWEKYWSQLQNLRSGDKDLMKDVQKKDLEFDKLAQSFR